MWVTICTVSGILQNSANTAEKVSFWQIQEGIGETDNFWCRQSLQDERETPGHFDSDWPANFFCSVRSVDYKCF